MGTTADAQHTSNSTLNNELDEDLGPWNYWEDPDRVQACMRQDAQGELLKWDDVRAELYFHFLSGPPPPLVRSGTVTPNAAIDLLRYLSNFFRDSPSFKGFVTHWIDRFDRVFLQQKGRRRLAKVPAQNGSICETSAWPNRIVYRLNREARTTTVVLFGDLDRRELDEFVAVPSTPLLSQLVESSSY